MWQICADNVLRIFKRKPPSCAKKKRKKLKELEKGIKMCFNKELAPRF